ncbi:MAG: UpxY family transcription antiterminator [Desulfosarcina sp.]|nr:UpxY family transcription antiterminator [Desulfobacterales bacterium]
MKKNSLVYSWYSLHTRSRFENVVYDRLSKKSVESFIPKIKVKSKRRDRNAMINVPLFPGYLFVRTDLRPVEHLEILKTIGAVRLLGNRKGPVPVPDETIESLKIMVNCDATVVTGNIIRKGEKVMVVYGPFAGLTGIFVRYKGQGRVVVNIATLGQSASVDINQKDIERLPEIL